MISETKNYTIPADVQQAGLLVHIEEVEGPHQHYARETLLGLSNWDKGTVVEEALMTAGPPTALAPVSEGRAILVMVCLNACRALHVWGDDGSAPLPAPHPRLGPPLRP